MNTVLKYFQIHILIILCSSLYQSSAFGEDLKIQNSETPTRTGQNPAKKRPNNSEQQSKQIETVLDKLEKHLTDKEPDPNLVNNVIPLQMNTKPIFKYSPSTSAKINGQTPSAKNIQDLQKKINEYEARIDILESEIHKFKSEIADTSNTDNQVKLEVKSKDSSNFIIRTLVASLDGQTLYNQVDSSGLWMPTKSVPVFYGPLQPGDHRFDVTATLAPLSQTGLEMPTWKQKTLQQSFNFSIPDGKIRKGVTVELSDSKGDGSQPIAIMNEVELK